MQRLRNAFPSAFSYPGSAPNPPPVNRPGSSSSRSHETPLTNRHPTSESAGTAVRPRNACPVMGTLTPPTLPSPDHNQEAPSNTASNHGGYSTVFDFLPNSMIQLREILKTALVSIGFSSEPKTFEPLEFDAPKNWPKASAQASPREQWVLGQVVGLIEQHAKGLYDAVFKKSHQAGIGVTEAGPLLDPDNRVYLAKPGNLYEQMNKLIDGLSSNESRLVYTLLVETDKKTASLDQILIGGAAKKDGFNLSSTMEKIKPIVEHYSGKKLNPEDHKVPGVKYHASFMKTSGLRPNTKRLPVKVTQQLAYHASIAILLDALKKRNYPDAHAKTKAIFDEEKLHAREHVWDIATGDGHGKDIPDYMPSLHADAFRDVDLPAETKIAPALIAVATPSSAAPVETCASVAIHSVGNRCLSEFLDHTQDPPVKRYAVSLGKPPMVGTASSASQLFDDPKKALHSWSSENS